MGPTSKGREGRGIKGGVRDRGRGVNGGGGGVISRILLG